MSELTVKRFKELLEKNNATDNDVVKFSQGPDDETYLLSMYRSGEEAHVIWIDVGIE